MRFPAVATRHATALVTAIVAGVASAVGAAALVVLAPTAASAAGIVTITPGGPLPADAPTTVQLTGAGFQSVAGGFGGIYVLFGWVDGSSWQPSKGGQTGAQLRYAPDEASAANAGRQKFVAFPGGETSTAANGGELKADGTWATELTVPGARFTASDAAGDPVEIDCLAVQCGVITIGAHGLANANNETFTPVTFTGTSVGTPVGTSVAEPTNEPSATADSESSPTPEPAAAPTSAAVPADDASSGPPVAALGAVALVVAAAVAFFVVRARRAPAGT